MSRQNAAIDMNVCSTIELPPGARRIPRENRHSLFHTWR
jgi:hypothetical protein